jgi:TetR/AcrR family transcriptional regulator, transcriptional repressor for nem operon
VRGFLFPLDLEAFTFYHDAMKPSSAPMKSPRSPGRPREFDIDHALDKAIGVFSELGYQATSLSKLTEAMEIAEGSLYKAFQDKRGVFLAALERYLLLRNDGMQRRLATAATGRDRVKTILAVYAEDSTGKKGQRGCLVVNSMVNLASIDAEMAKRVTERFAVLEKLLVRFIEEGRADGSIAPRVEAATTGRLLLCVVQGMRVVGKTGRTEAEMTRLVDDALRLLG